MRPEPIPAAVSWLDLHSRRRPSEEVSPAIPFDEFVEEEWDISDRDEQRTSR